MNQEDIEFFEAYKHLDKLCSEIFNCQNGVSAYISEMEQLQHRQNVIATWNSDYKKLKHIRWVRNKIAHSISDNMISNEEDLLFAQSFYKRIMTQEDPCSILRKIEQKPKLSQNNNTVTFSYQPVKNNEYNKTNSRKSNKLCLKLFCFIIIVAIVLLLIYMFKG